MPSNQHPKSREHVVIETDRLLLRLAEPKDVPQILRYFEENRDHLAATNPSRPAGFYTDEFWALQIARSDQEFQADQSARLFVFGKQTDAEVIGNVSLTQFARGPFQACYLGYGIAQRHEGKGLMHEAVEATIEYAFRDLNLHRIMANHLPENFRSAKLLQRLGFVREGTAKQYLRINGEWRDHVLTSITNENWLESLVSTQQRT